MSPNPDDDGQDTGQQETGAHWYESAWGEMDERFRNTTQAGDGSNSAETGESSEVIA